MENLKALVFGRQLTDYQRALAQREFKDMEERLELLEKAVKNNAVLPHVSNRRELLIAFLDDINASCYEHIKSDEGKVDAFISNL